MYDLIITWHIFQDHEVNEVLKATNISMDVVLDILKMYNCSPSLHIKISKSYPTSELCEKYKED